MHKKIMSGYFLINQGEGKSFAMVQWIEPIDSDALLFFHPLFQSLQTLFGGLFNEGHVFSEVLLGVDFSFLTPLQLIQSELRDRGAVFLVQRLPDRRTFGLQNDGVLVAGRIGCPCGAPAYSQ
ncbi:MAG: hypothetical protein AAB433_06905 [Nitrospirota bacterium]